MDLLFSLMTADAAAQHGHEFSPQPSQAPSRASPVSRSPLTVFSSATGVGGRTLTRTPNSPSLAPLSDNPRSGATSPDEVERPSRTEDALMVGPSIQHSTPIQSTTPSRSASLSSSVASTDQRPAPQNVESVPRARVKRRPRAKTSYNIAHPPPNTGLSSRHSLHLRPRVLLQLQQLSPSDRPTPAYEVLPSSLFSNRWGRRVSRILRTREDDKKRKLGPDDLIVLRAGAYRAVDQDAGHVDVENGETSPGEVKIRDRKAIGIICNIGRSKEGCISKDASTSSSKKGSPDVEAEICMDDGVTWQASAMANGGYEFLSTDEHGLQLRARWVPRPGLIRRQSGNQSPLSSTERNFIFSTITPGSRRHPVIGTLTPTTLEVNETYNMPHNFTGSHTPAQSPAIELSENAGSNGHHETTNTRPITTEPALHKLLTVTGIWVAFREAWSPVFRYASSPRTPGRPVSPTSGEDYRGPYLSTSTDHTLSKQSNLSTRQSRCPTRAFSFHSSRSSSRSPTPDGRSRDIRRSLAKLRWPASSPPASPPPDHGTATGSHARNAPSKPRLNRSATYTPLSTRSTTFLSGASSTGNASGASSANSTAPSTPCEATHRPRRANSTGTAFLARSRRHGSSLRVDAALVETELEHIASRTAGQQRNRVASSPVDSGRTGATVDTTSETHDFEYSSGHPNRANGLNIIGVDEQGQSSRSAALLRTAQPTTHSPHPLYRSDRANQLQGKDRWRRYSLFTPKRTYGDGGDDLSSRAKGKRRPVSFGAVEAALGRDETLSHQTDKGRRFGKLKRLVSKLGK